MAKADDPKAIIGLSGPRAQRVVGPPPHVLDHEMLRCIGQGSYGEVWLARSAVGTWRAVKVIYRAHFKDARPYEREFSGIQKYEPISRANDGLVDVLQIGRNDAEGYFYYVMELADDAAENPTDESRTPTDPNQSLASAAAYIPRTLARELHARRRLPVEECLRLGISLNLALGHLHRAGLIHRDVKPSNIIFVNAVPKLADIGLVAEIADAHSFVGTEGFIPPEGPNSPQGDIYALGKVLYESSMGKDRQEFPEPFSGLGTGGDSKELMELNVVLLKACAAKPKERYESAEAMNADLALLHSGKSVQQKHAMGRLKLMTRIGVGAVAVMVLGIVPYYLAINETRLARAAAAKEREQRVRADKESARAQEEVWLRCLDQAKASRFGNQLGRRLDALEALKKAAAIRPALELRNEAIAALALTDLRVGSAWDYGQEGAYAAGFDHAFEHYALGSLTNGVLSIRQVKDNHEIVQLAGFSPPFGLIRFSRGGRWLAVRHGTTPQNFDICDLRSNQPAMRFPGRDCRTMDFSADSRLAAISFHHGGDTNYPILIVDLVTGQNLRTLEHGTLPWTITFHPFRKQLATSSDESREVRIWDLESEGIPRVLPHPKPVLQIAWNPEGDILACGCADNQVYLWDVAHETKTHVLPGHSGFPVELSFSFDGQFLASRGYDGTLRFWDPWTGQQLFKQPVAGGTFDFSGTDYRYGYFPAKGKMGFLELVPSRECRLLRPGPAPDAQGQNCDFSPDGRLLLTAHEDGVRLWDLANGKVAAFMPESRTRYAIFEPRGDRILVASTNGIKEWIFTRAAGDQPIEVAFSRPISKAVPDELFLSGAGRVLAFPAAASVHVLELASGVETILPKQEYARLQIGLSPDGNLAACVAPYRPDGGGPIKVFNVANSKLLQSLRCERGARPLFSPNGKWLLTGGELEYHLWNLQTWAELYPPISRGEDAGYFAFMAFSPDSTMVALTIGRDTIRLIEARSGRELATLQAPKASDIYHLSFSPDATQLAVLYRHGPVDVWDLRLIRQQLAAMKLDWELPPYPKAAEGLGSQSAKTAAMPTDK